MKSVFRTVLMALTVVAVLSLTLQAQEVTPKAKGMEHKGMEMQGRMKVGQKSNAMQNVMQQCTEIVKNMHGGNPEHMQKMMHSGMMTTVMAMFETAKSMQKMQAGLEKMKENQALMNDPQSRKNIEKMEKNLQSMMKAMSGMVENIKPIEEKTRK